MYITDNKGNINNERNMRQRRSLHVCRHVRTHTHTHTRTHAVHEEDQAQELAVDAARGRHERRQESHVPVAAICVTIIADLVGSGALEDVVRVVGVAELALMLPYLTSADEIVAQVDVHQQIDLLRHADFADFEIGAAVALTREHPLVGGGETSVVTNALQRPQGMVVRAGPIRSMMEAGVDVVPVPSPPMKYRWQRMALRKKKKRSEGKGCR